ncbi:MAG: NAD(+) synthase [Actinomycetaceae bacterium]|nr:NAD(+) synthase [Actinomycetaceae bacterium]
MTDFYSPIARGFVRVAAASIPTVVADPKTNAQTVIAAIEEASDEGASVIVFPELTLTGASAEDLFSHDLLIDECEMALLDIASATEDCSTLAIVGTPLRSGGKLLNAAVAISNGELHAAWLKSDVDRSRSSYESRWFSPAEGIDFVSILSVPIPAGDSFTLLVQDIPGLVIGTQIGDNVTNFAPQAALPIPGGVDSAGVTLIANPAASPALVGKKRQRRLQAAYSSQRNHAAYIYAGAGAGESTTDSAWDGDAFIFEDGALLAENERFATGPRVIYADLDLRALSGKRKFDAKTMAAEDAFGATVIPIVLGPHKDWELSRDIARFPYISSDREKMREDLEEAFNLQVQALAQRLRAIGNPHPVIGISGGLDSTQALLVCAEAMDRLGRPREDILTFTMPGFGTTDHTKNNAVKLCESLGTTFEELDIRPTAKQMLTEMGHPFGRGEPVYDVTFENVQAGLRTDFLFRIANARGGIVVGTGDFSELMLGWCTFGVGDHMSHYSVNPGIPKTLMQHLIRWIIRTDRFGAGVNDTLQSILDTEITPELIPTHDGAQIQSTQAKIGPYELQDFNAYYMLHLGMTPEDVAFRALHAWGISARGTWPEGYEDDAKHEYSLKEILEWLRLFTRRFFANQFKRSTLPNGPKIVEGAGVSPRGDLRLGSDVTSAAWVRRIDALAEDLGLTIDRK